MTPIEMLALDKLIKDSQSSAIRKQVSPGTYKVNLDVHIEGDIKVEEDYMKRPTVSVPWGEAYALFREVAVQGLNELIARIERGETIGKEDLLDVQRAGFLSEEIMVETMKQAIEIKEGKAQGSLMARVPEVAAAAERVKETIAGGMGLTPSNGRVLTDLKFEQIHAAPEGSANTETISKELTKANVSAEVS